MDKKAKTIKCNMVSTRHNIHIFALLHHVDIKVDIKHSKSVPYLQNMTNHILSVLIFYRLKTKKEINKVSHMR